MENDIKAEIKFTDPLLGESTTPLIPPEEMGMSERAYRGSWQELLYANIGLYTFCEFLIGTTPGVVKEGILTSVGVNYFVIKNITENIHIACDIYSLRFATFLPPGKKPAFATISSKGSVSTTRNQRRQ